MNITDIKLKALFIIRSKKAVIIGAAVVVLLVLGFMYKGLVVAALVNGAPISRFQVLGQLEKMSGKNVLDSLITKKLIEDEAKAKGITVTQDEVNAEISKIEEQIKTQGGTLDTALAQQGMTREDLETQISVNTKIQKLLADKLIVTGEEIAKYITDNKVNVPKGQEQQFNDNIKAQLAQQKLSTEAQAFVASLKASAKIKYFVNY
ncbi:MAG: SurA N-terminal domain-containing protein [bacterium]|nr:SurA N-terminal domain-containing protein [bacterium]